MSGRVGEERYAHRAEAPREPAHVRARGCDLRRERRLGCAAVDEQHHVVVAARAAVDVDTAAQLDERLRLAQDGALGWRRDGDRSAMSARRAPIGRAVRHHARVEYLERTPSVVARSAPRRTAPAQLVPEPAGLLRLAARHRNARMGRVRPPRVRLAIVRLDLDARGAAVATVEVDADRVRAVAVSRARRRGDRERYGD